MKVIGADLDVMRCGMHFGVVIAHVFTARVPFNVENSTLYLVCDPEISHLHGAGPLAFDGVVCDTSGCGIVAVDGCWWLWVA